MHEIAECWSALLCTFACCRSLRSTTLLKVLACTFERHFTLHGTESESVYCKSSGLYWGLLCVLPGTVAGYVSGYVPIPYNCTVLLCRVVTHAKQCKAVESKDEKTRNKCLWKPMARIWIEDWHQKKPKERKSEISKRHCIAAIAAGVRTSAVALHAAAYLLSN